MPPMDGKTYFRALAYALAVVPSGDDDPSLQHVTFAGNRVVGSDGRRRHDGYLPSSVDAPLSVARISAVELGLALDYAHRMSKRRGGSFSVEHRQSPPESGHFPGVEAVITYGAQAPLVHPLEAVNVGSHPEGLNEWVPQDAPLNPSGLGRIACGDLKSAMAWWKSWDKDYGTCEIRGGLDGGPLRADITSGGRIAATAFLLPLEHVTAELREGPTLFDKHKRGRSNLDLDLSGDGAAPPPPRILKIGEVEINVTGLPEDDAELLGIGPCKHRDEVDACLPCTELKVATARDKQKALAMLDGEESPKPKRRRKPGKQEEAFTPLAPDGEAPATH